MCHHQSESSSNNAHPTKRCPFALSSNPTAAKKCPGFTVRFSDPSACGRSLCNAMPRIIPSPLATAAFQQTLGHNSELVLIGRSHRTWHPVGTGISVRPFTRSQRRLSATITRSKFLTCTFVSTLKTFANPFDSRLHRSVRFRGRTGATSTPGTRFPRQSPALLISPRPPLPFRSSFENPPDQSVQPVQSQEVRLAERPIALRSPWLPLSIPPRISAPDPLRPARLSFRKSWN